MSKLGLGIKATSESTGSIVAASTLQQYADQVRRYFGRRLRKSSLAMDPPMDLAQEVHERLLRMNPETPVQEPMAFVCEIAGQVLAKHSQDTMIDATETDLEPSSETLSKQDQDFQQQIMRALSELPRMHAAVLIAHKRDGLSHEAVAAKYELSVEAVQKYLCEARARVRLSVWQENGSSEIKGGFG